jgi:hypothetical protein
MILTYCRRTAYAYFEDYIESLKTILPLHVVLYDKSETIILDPTRDYIFIQYFPEKYARHGNRVYFLNTEQLSRFADFLPDQLARFHGYSKLQVMDYSSEHIQIMKSLGISGMHLPYVLYESEQSRLLEYIKQEPKQYDFAFTGTMSVRRFMLLERIRNLGFRVHVIEGWNEKRDTQIAQCRALINIHFEDSYTIYESIRCDRWIFAGMRVLTECSTTDSPFCKVANLHTITKEEIEAFLTTPINESIADSIHSLQSFDRHNSAFDFLQSIEK